jgi:hypothetical protein
LGVRKEKELFMQGYNELLRKIQPSAIICYGKPFEEMKGNVIEVDYSKTNNRSKGYVIHKTYIFDDYVEEGMGGVSAPKISSVYLSDLPSNVQRAYYGYENVGWKGNFPGQANGTKAGKKYKNKPIKLPETNNDGIKVSYREYDVNDKIEGQPRDSGRLIRDSNGIVYYTPNRYDTFVIIIGG